MEGLLFIAVIVVACPLMMWFMMRGMNGGNSADADPAPDSSEAALRSEIAELRKELDDAGGTDRVEGPPRTGN